MLEEINKIKWDVIGLSETKVKETGVEPLDSGHRFYLSGNGKSRSNGVGFLVKKSLIPTVDKCISLSQID